MGQPVAVKHLKTSRTGIARFETNRVLTGMGHERYKADEPIYGNRPADVVARRIIETVKGVRGVHVNSSIITVDIDHGTDVDAIAETISSLYTYYTPGVLPPVIDTGEDASA